MPQNTDSEHDHSPCVECLLSVGAEGEEVGYLHVLFVSSHPRALREREESHSAGGRAETAQALSLLVKVAV